MWRKISSPFISIILVFALGSCMANSDSKPPSLNKSYRSSVEIKYGENDYNGIITRHSKDNWELELTSPSEVGGMMFFCTNGDFSATLGEMEITTKPLSQTEKGAFNLITGVLDLVARGEGITSRKQGEWINTTGIHKNSSFILSTIPSTDEIASLTVPSASLTVTFSGYAILEGDINPTEKAQDE